MRWPEFLRSRDDDLPPESALDIHQIAALGKSSPEAAREAVRALETERKLLRRRLKVLSRQLKRMTSVRVRNVGRSGAMMGSIQMAHDIRSMHDAGQNSGISMQEADTFARLNDVEALIRELRNRG